MPGAGEHGVTVAPVATRRARAQFMALPWRLHHGRPHWSAPPRVVTRHILNHQGNPFWQHAEGALFLATRHGGRPVGRIGTQIDHTANAHWNDRIGSFGFFECIDDRATAAALFDAAAAWLRARGMRVMRGPMSPSMNAECGFMTAGFDYPPAFMMACTPPYYVALADACGFARAREIVSYRRAGDVPVPAKGARVLARLTGGARVRVEHLTRRTVTDNAGLLCALFNECWADNWGYAPVSLAEVRALVQALKYVGHEETSLLLFVNEQPAGVYIALPDLSQVLTTGNGRVTPALCWRWLWRRRYITRSRTFMFGLRAPYRNQGLASVLFYAADAFLRTRYRTQEFGWVLEDNTPAHVMMRFVGGEISARYTIVERAL
jgi:GNAT superfamily N-acetyltransferase